ncbi:Fungal specific transcription factor domain [Ceratobasidium sp. AG-Ba]|nr:Fungal specific transcription factor domain [Ceratobasidium sp. AG-Ba]
MVLGTQIGYTLFKKCTPLFLDFVNTCPDLRSPNSTISLHGALSSPHFGACRFAAFDTILSVAFAVPPLICYDATHRNSNLSNDILQLMDSVYGWPVEILFILGKVNAWRISRWMGQADAKALSWQEIQGEIQNWRSPMEYNDQPSNVVGRFAIYEAWRQAALIYLYMGMCMVNSADPRVETATWQVVQLAGAIESGTNLERHIFMPCLIVGSFPRSLCTGSKVSLFHEAGAAARLEKHRAALRSKLFSARDDSLWVLPGSDTVSVLDHLWHGAGANGTPTTWEDYVSSRLEALPLGDVSGM